MRKLLPAEAAGKTLEILLQNEARIGQKGTLAYVWVRCGARSRAVQDTRYSWAYLFGAVCPERAVGAGLVMPHTNTEAMTLHLAEIGKAVSPGAHAALVMDGAGWHVSDKLFFPDNITLVKLLPYALELNDQKCIYLSARHEVISSSLQFIQRYRECLLRCLHHLCRGSQYCSLHHYAPLGTVSEYLAVGMTGHPRRPDSSEAAFSHPRFIAACTKLVRPAA